jgi:hypothetical protein
MAGTAIHFCARDCGMMARRAFGRSVLGVMAGAATAVLSGCGKMGGSKRYRFKMTVEVETPQGLKRGSAVYEVSAGKLVALTSEEAERSAGARGEALVVDLVDGPVFVLMKPPEGSKHDDLAQLSMAVLDPAYQNDWVESAGRIAGSWSTLKGEAKREDWPMMVRFKDLNDPKSVERVDPDSIGVTRIVLETTSDDVTTGIEKTLGWLGDRGLVVSGPTTNSNLTETIYHEAFWLGPKR